MATKLTWRTLRLRPTVSVNVAPLRLLVHPSSSRPLTCLRRPRYSICAVTARHLSTATATSPAVPPADEAVAGESDELEESNSHVPFETLRDLISPGTMQAITVKPYQLTEMTPVQEQVLPLMPQLTEPYNPKLTDAERSVAPPRDLLVKAKTGTGKTLAFLVPAIEARLKSIEYHAKQAAIDAGAPGDRLVEAKAKRVFAKTRVGTLIISPTRELATQIANEALKLTAHQPGFEVRLLVGGESKRQQLREWFRGRPDIVVATPGRMRDIVENEPDVLENVQHTAQLVLDEADTLLDMGFRDDLDAIVQQLPRSPQRQTFLYSATVSTAIRQIARSTLDPNHLFINCVSDTASPVHAHVPQYHTVLPSAAEQMHHINRLIMHDQLVNPGKSKVLVFLPTTKMTQLYSNILRFLSKTIFPAKASSRIYELHSKRSQSARSNTSDAFRNDNSGAAVLVTSDVSARGVDYPGVTRVIQIGIPGSGEQYVHRVGRTGRAGTMGRGDLVLLPWEIGFLTWQLGNIPLKPVTTNEVKKQLAELVEKFDKEPHTFFPEGEKRPERSRDRRSSRGAGPPPVVFNAPLSHIVTDLDKEIEHLLSRMDEEAVRETFASLLGYYIAKAPELRTQKGTIVEGLKDWSVQAGGLARAPFVSDEFLAKLGFNDNRTKRFGQEYLEPKQMYRRASWEGRGRQSTRDLPRDRGEPRKNLYTSGDEEGEDPASKPERFLGHRFGIDKVAPDDLPGKFRPRRPSPYVNKAYAKGDSRERGGFSWGHGSGGRGDRDRGEGRYGGDRREGGYQRGGGYQRDGGEPKERRQSWGVKEE